MSPSTMTLSSLFILRISAQVAVDVRPRQWRELAFPQLVLINVISPRRVMPVFFTPPEVAESSLLEMCNFIFSSSMFIPALANYNPFIRARGSTPRPSTTPRGSGRPSASLAPSSRFVTSLIKDNISLLF